MEQGLDPQEEIEIDRYNRKMQRKYLKSPSTMAILDAFSEEAKYLVPKQIKRLERELRPLERYLKDLRQSWYDKYTKIFIEQVIRTLYMPKKKVEHLKSLKIMERLMCKTTRGVTDADIQMAKAVSIWDIYSFEKRKRNMACCPFHSEKTPSFSVRGNRFVCFGCGEKGDSIDFVQKLHNLTFYKAVEFLNGK